MLGWRRRKQGFEWHQYVRTTILVRREQRRQRLDEARQAAVDGLKGAQHAAVDHLANAGQAAAAGAKMAGRKGAEIGKAGVSGAKRGVGQLLAAAVALPRGLGAVLAPVLAPLATRAGTWLQGPAAWLASPLATLVLALLAAASTIAAVGRLASFGADADTLTAFALATVALILLAGPRLGALRARNAPIAAVRGFLPGTGMLVMGAALAGSGLLAWALLGQPTSSTSGPDPARALAPDSPQDRLQGRASALAGDRLRIAGKTVRLDGIEAPERNQTCVRANGKRWSCGSEAGQALARLVRGRAIICLTTDTDADGTQLASCRDSEKDLAAELVRGGHAFAVAGFWSRYASLEAQARDAKLGLWQGEAMRPAEHRARLWEEAKAKAPDGCPIKGQISRGGRIYLLPWSERYAQARLDAKRGERWFCSEEEARSAGWRPASAS